MKSKLLKSLLSAVLVFGLSSSLAFAKTGPTIEKKDYKETMVKVRHLVENGKMDDAQNLPEVVKLKEDLKESGQEASFLKSLDSSNDELVKEKLKNVQIEGNQQKIVSFEDGSFIVVQSETKKVTDQVSVLGTYNTYSGASWTNDSKYQIWGVYLAAEYHLITSFNVYSNSTTITNTSVAGTYAIFPTSVSETSSKIVTNYSRYNQTQASYKQVDGVSIGGQAIGITHYYTFSTYITVNYAGNGNINFTTSAVWNG